MWLPLEQETRKVRRNDRTVTTCHGLSFKKFGYNQRPVRVSQCWYGYSPTLEQDFWQLRQTEFKYMLPKWSGSTSPED